MNTFDLNDLRKGCRNRLLEFSGDSKTQGSTVAITNRQDPIPRQITLDQNVSSTEYRAYGILSSYGATPFPGMRKLGKDLGGKSGAVAKTDGLFLERWILKEIVKDNNNRPIGTVYVLFDYKLSVNEMAEEFPEWKTFIIRLACSIAKEKQPLARRAKQIIKDNPNVFSSINTPGSRNPEPDNTESGSSEQNDRFIDKVPFKKKAHKDKPAAKGGSKTGHARRSQLDIENFLGFEFPHSISILDDPDRVLSILLRMKVDETQARHVFAEFDASASRSEINSPWGLLVTLATQAASPDGLRLSAEGEKRIPPWN